MTEQRFRVGIVGLEPGRGWAARAHVPALRALSDSYEIVGVADASLFSDEAWIEFTQRAGGIKMSEDRQILDMMIQRETRRDHS